MGASFGVSAKGPHGSVVISNVVEIKVPAVVRNEVSKAYKASKKAAKTAGKAIGSGTSTAVGFAVREAKSELSKAGAELSKIGTVVDLDSELKPEQRSAIIQFLKDSARKKSGDYKMSDVPDVKGHSSLGLSASNSTINNALKIIGGGGFLPSDGNTGTFVYYDQDSGKLSGAGMTIDWKVNIGW